MRITDDRYMKDRQRLDLAWRLIKHEARTRTISSWTRLSDHRIRALYKSYAPGHREQLIRHRGVSPFSLETIMHSARFRLESAIFAAICKSVHVLPNHVLVEPERMLPSVERGDLLCDAFEWFQHDVPAAKLTIEHGMLVLNELARGEQIELAGCRLCGGLILSDRLSYGRLECPFCARSDQRAGSWSKQRNVLGTRDDT
ncbi:FlhC family transcriptional regulator [Peristeroidobacter soli]|uniref:FlhC family transcriptional regulator n=1 Tax=Peristeroidobacter soli TaxID=2497877 RepID=UPI001300B7E3|nr:FlhC family transcriptional regulator [Peristeroidobacter soli]